MRAEGGVALLEVLVALAIISGAGLALLEVVSAGLSAERDARFRRVDSYRCGSYLTEKSTLMK